MFDLSLAHPPSAFRSQPLERDSARSVSELLLEALQGLADLETSRSMVRGRRAVRWYHDADFQYIEAAVPELDGVAADICVHDGRVYVRVAR